MRHQRSGTQNALPPPAATDGCGRLSRGGGGGGGPAVHAPDSVLLFEEHVTLCAATIMGDNEYSSSIHEDGLLAPPPDSNEAKFTCSSNKLVIGVAAVAPVAWSSDGSWFVHATGDNSLHVCNKPGSSATFKVHGVLVGHSETVACMVALASTQPSRSNQSPTRRLFTQWSLLFSSPLPPTGCGFGMWLTAGSLCCPFCIFGSITNRAF